MPGLASSNNGDTSPLAVDRRRLDAFDPGLVDCAKNSNTFITRLMMLKSEINAAGVY
ncbi:MAG: hypothetical protein ACREAC_31560 [Blastocatellia bacterium]